MGAVREVKSQKAMMIVIRGGLFAPLAGWLVGWRWLAALTPTGLAVLH